MIILIISYQHAQVLKFSGATHNYLSCIRGERSHGAVVSAAYFKSMCPSLNPGPDSQCTALSAVQSFLWRGR